MAVTHQDTRLSLTAADGCHSQRQTAVTHSGRQLSLTAADGCHSQRQTAVTHRHMAVTHSGRWLSLTAADGCHSQRQTAVTHRDTQLSLTPCRLLTSTCLQSDLMIGSLTSLGFSSTFSMSRLHQSSNCRCCSATAHNTRSKIKG